MYILYTTLLNCDIMYIIYLYFYTLYIYLYLQTYTQSCSIVKQSNVEGVNDMLKFIFKRNIFGFMIVIMPRVNSCHLLLFTPWHHPTGRGSLRVQEFLRTCLRSAFLRSGSRCCNDSFAASGTEQRTGGLSGKKAVECSYSSMAPLVAIIMTAAYRLLLTDCCL